MSPTPAAAGRIVVGLDIGSTKICTVVGEVADDGVLDIIGEGTVPSEGLKKGVVVNLERTIGAVRRSVEAAERVAGVDVKTAFVGVGGTHLKALTSHGLAAIRRGREITRSDVERAVENAKAVPLDPNQEVIHSLPQEYVVDGQEEIKDPIGMAGVRLEVDVHIVAGAQGPLQNLRRCVAEARVHPVSLVLQALASGAAVLEEDEHDVTTIVIDIGGGTTDVGVFRRGNLAHSAVVPLGGEHVTQDIAHMFKIPPDSAELLKRKHGSAVPELADPSLTLEVPQGGFVDVATAPELAEVIKPRVQEIFSMVRQEVDRAIGPMEILAGGVVLTGGGAMLKGIEEVARERFRLPVRIGRPRGLSGLTDVVATPAHATAVGLVRFGMGLTDDRGAGGRTRGSDGQRSSPIAQLREWLKEWF